MGRVSPWMPENDPVRLAVYGKLMEELGELSSAVARCQIQGIDEAEPVTAKPNRQWLCEEAADVEAMLKLLYEETGIAPAPARVAEKLSDKRRWLQMIRDAA